MNTGQNNRSARSSTVTPTPTSPQALTRRLHPAHDQAAHQAKQQKEGRSVMHTPQVYYWTQAVTKGTQHVASRLHCPATLITRDTPAPTAPYILLTPTYAGRPDKGGYIPGPVNNWLKSKQAQRYLVGVIGTGDINWGEEFCAAAHEISNTHNVPVLYRVDRWGNADDHAAINAGINEHWATLCQRRIATLKAKKESNGES